MSPSPCRFLTGSKSVEELKGLFSAIGTIYNIVITHEGGIIDADGAGHSVTSRYVSAKPVEPDREHLSHTHTHQTTHSGGGFLQA